MSENYTRVPAQDIADLVAAVQELTLVVTRIASLPHSTSSTTVRRFDEEWEIVEEEYAPGAPNSPHAEVYPVVAGVDYEQVPQFCYDLAKHRLTGASIGFVARTDRAFQSGRLAKESLRIGASYHQAEGIGLQLAHWIVLRSPSSTSPCRVTTKKDLNKLLGQNKAGPLPFGRPSHPLLSSRSSALLLAFPSHRW